MLPGIDEAIKHEMKAIGIYSLDQLVAQDEFPEWKQLARRVLNATDGDLRDKERQAVQSDKNGQPERVLGIARPSSLCQSTKKESNKKESFQESQPEDITFSFSMEA